MYNLDLNTSMECDLVFELTCSFYYVHVTSTHGLNYIQNGISFILSIILIPS